MCLFIYLFFHRLILSGSGVLTLKCVYVFHLQSLVDPVLRLKALKGGNVSLLQRFLKRAKRDILRESMFLCKRLVIIYWGGGPLYLWRGSLFFELHFGEGHFLKKNSLRGGL